MPTGLSVAPCDRGSPSFRRCLEAARGSAEPGSPFFAGIPGTASLSALRLGCDSEHPLKVLGQLLGAGQPACGQGQPARPRGSRQPLCPSPPRPFLLAGPGRHRAPPAAAPGAAAQRADTPAEGAAAIPPSSSPPTPPPRPAAAYLGAGSAPALSARRPAEPAGAGGRRALQKPSPRARCEAGNPALSSAGASGFPRPAGEGRGSAGLCPSALRRRRLRGRLRAPARSAPRSRRPLPVRLKRRREEEEERERSGEEEESRGRG